MYNQKSEQDSMEIITWTILGSVSSILLFLVGRGLINKLTEGIALGYIGLTILFLITLSISTRTFFEVKSYIKKARKENKEKKRNLKLFKFEEGKLIQIGYWKAYMPGTVNTCPEEWSPEVLVKSMDGFKDYPNKTQIKN